MASNATTSYNFMVFILFVIFLSYCITACKKRRQRARALRRNMNPGLAALARQEREAPVLTYTVARRSSAEHLIATKALRRTATALILIAAQCSAIP